MADPRINGDHLETARWDRYQAAAGVLLAARGPATADCDPLITRPVVRVPRAESPTVPPGGTYVLVRLDDGRRHRLRTGVNALGRYPENDIVLLPNHVSRRHCLVLVHVTGGCEVADTASRNGTFVNGRRVSRADLHPGDVLALTDQRFAVEWAGPDGHVLPEAEAADTSFMAGPATGSEGWPPGRIRPLAVIRSGPTRCGGPNRALPTRSARTSPKGGGSWPAHSAAG